MGLDINHTPVAFMNVYFINLCIAVIPFAFAVLCFLRLCTLFYRPRFAVLTTLLFLFCSPLVPYTTELWGHSIATSFLIIGWWNMEEKRLKTAGLFMALACSVDYLALIASGLLFIYAIKQNLRRAIPLFIGGLPPLIFTLWYQHLCFGSPFTLTHNEQVNSSFVDSSLFLGRFGFPDFEIFLELLIGQRRGIILALPILLFAPFALFKFYQEKKVFLNLQSLELYLKLNTDLTLLCS